ncbi:MAG TPA: response regulator [Enhygromyxa sp.]|nr:response regulator [Enhygromyxa sp.]
MDAMEGVVDRPRRIRIRAFLDGGESIRIELQDHGVGLIEPERIFEPFFTTKDAAHGSGLGLATIYGIVRLAKGHVRVDSEVGQGTCFTILWPEVTREAQIEAQVELEPTQPPSVADGTRILLVDDDQAVRRTVAKILEHGGYQVLTAEGPSAALELAREGLHVDLIVTDVVMPKMSGPAMIEWLGTLLGSRPVVFMSGYASAAQSKLGGHPGFLPKPFTPGQLLAKVRAQLGG